MSDDVQFDTDVQTDAMRRPPAAASFGQHVSDVSGMAGWLIKHGWAKSPQSAQMILLAVVVADIVATFIVIKYFL